MASIPGFIPRNDALKTSLKWGKTAEDRFGQAVFAGGGVVVAKAGLRQEKYEHWDYRITFGEEEYTVDVKAMKSFRRGGEQQSTYVCLELHGSHRDSKGWLFGGHADMIAFETPYGFCLTWREAVGKAALHLVDTKDFANTSAEAIYRVYNRRDSEAISWVELTDLVEQPGVMAMMLRSENKKVHHYME